MTTCEGCEYEEQHCIPRNCIDKSGERKNYTPAPAPAPKVHGIDCLFDEFKDCKTCEANPNIKQVPAPTPKVQESPLDIPACLALMIAALDKAIDQSPYDKEKDALIDAMESLQVAAKVSAEVAQFEDQEDYPLAPGVPMR